MSGPLTETNYDSPPRNTRQSSWGDSSPWGSAPPTSRRLSSSNDNHQRILDSSSSFGAAHADASTTTNGDVAKLPLLNDSNVPPLYLNQWKAAQPVRDAISLGSLHRVLSSGGIKQSSIDKIVSLTTPESGIITKREFYVALALLANAQLHRDLNLEAVARARAEGMLPIPNLSSNAATSSSSPSSPTTSYTSPPSCNRTLSTISTSEDPWGTLAQPSSGPSTMPAPYAGSGGSSKINSTSNGAHHPSMNASRAFTTVDEADADDGHAFGDNLLEGTSLGEWSLGKQTKVEVRMRDELKGLVFKHTIWFVATERGATVERRYSDFVWLHDCLVRRYPFRLLPCLPPKQVHVPGYMAVDDLFLERRRRGMERFLVVLVNHPTLKHDHLVHTFLNEQSELALWRKHTPISLEEESASRILTSEEEMQVPSDLEDRLANLRSRIIPLVEHWTRVTSMIDRIAHRRLNQAADFDRMSEALHGALDCERSGWRPVECENVEADVEKVASGLQKVAVRIRQVGDEQLETTVEELKRHRELYVNMKELFTRHIHLAPDSVDKLKKRVEIHMKKLESFRDSATPLAPAEFDKLSHSVSADQRSIDLLLRRRSFIRWCMWQEILWLFRSTSLLSDATKEWVANEIVFGENIKVRWEELQEELGNLIMGSTSGNGSSRVASE